MRRTLPLALLLAPTVLAAQLPNPSLRALALGGSYTVLARGYEATGWNPASLGATGNPGFTLGLPAAQLEFGSNSYGLSDFQKYAGTTLTPADKTYLLGKIDTSLDLRTSIGISPVGLSIANFAVSIGTATDMTLGLGKDAVDLALNGNAGRANPFTAAGSHGNGWAATTLAASFGLPIPIPLGRLSVGATYKKIWGHALGQAAELSSAFSVNPTVNVNATGHAIYTNYTSGFDPKGVSDILGGEGSPGTGYGVDVGGILELPGHITIGATLVNALGSMTWQADRLTYERSAYVVTQAPNGTVTNSLVRTTLVGAQIDGDAIAKAFKDSLLAHDSFAKVARAGVTWHLGGLLLAGEGALRLSSGLDRVPKQSVSAGAEYVLLGVLPLRAGIGTDFTQELTFSAGTGLYLGPLHLDVAASDVSSTTQAGVRVGAGLSLIF
ncbi:MAG: DUF5723 family protein [Gemmatimonadales bacterium]